MGTRILSSVVQFFALPLLAAHLPGGNITYECQGADQYLVTLTMFRDCSGFTMVDQTLAFASDCGTSFNQTLSPGSGTEVSQLCPGDLPNSTCNGGALPGMEVYTMQTTVLLPPCDGWTISLSLCCRSDALNITGNPGMYVEARLNNATAACNNSPEFTDPSVPYVCVDQPVSYNLGVTESDGNALRYRFIDARYMAPPPTSVVYAPGYSGAEPFPGMAIDSLSGQITFTPTLVGYIVTAVQVDEYDMGGDLVGSVMRDFPFVVTPCANNAPDPGTGSITNVIGTVEMNGPYALTLCEGGELCFDAVIEDADATQSLTLTSNVESVLPGASFGVIGTNPATATICWNALPGSAGSYAFTITAEDDACPHTAVQNYAYSITVAAAPDAGSSATLTVCTGSSPVDLFPVLGGDPDTCGIWTDDDATGALTGSTIDIALLPPGNYQFTYAAGCTPICGDDLSVVVVTVVAAPDAGEDNSIIVCENGPPFLLLDSLSGTPNVGGTWMGPGSTSAIYDPPANVPGLYCYTVTGTPPCAQDVACLTITELPSTDPECLGTGLGTMDAMTLTLLPMPANDVFTISWQGGGKADLRVMDTRGRIVLTALRVASGAMNPTGRWPEGFYTAQVSVDGRSSVRRLTIVH